MKCYSRDYTTDTVYRLLTRLCGIRGEERGLKEEEGLNNFLPWKKGGLLELRGGELNIGFTVTYLCSDRFGAVWALRVTVHLKTLKNK